MKFVNLSSSLFERGSVFWTRNIRSVSMDVSARRKWLRTDSAAGEVHARVMGWDEMRQDKVCGTLTDNNHWFRSLSIIPKPEIIILEKKKKNLKKKLGDHNKLYYGGRDMKTTAEKGFNKNKKKEKKRKRFCCCWNFGWSSQSAERGRRKQRERTTKADNISVSAPSVARRQWTAPWSL